MPTACFYCALAGNWPECWAWCGLPLKLETTVGLELIVPVVTALAAVIVILWRDNLKLRGALLKEKETALNTYRELLGIVKRRRDGP